MFSSCAALAACCSRRRVHATPRHAPQVGVGTEAVGTKIKRRENVFCKSPCDMLRLPEEDIKDLCEHYPALWR